MSEINTSLEVSGMDRHYASIELTQCTEQQENGQVCGRCRYRVGSVCDYDVALSASLHVYLIIACAIVVDVSDGQGKS